MIVTVRDPKILKSLEPEKVRTYLQMHHWQEQRQIEDKAAIWTRKNETGQEFEILLPLKSEFLDFPRRMAEVLQTLEEASQTSQLEILGDLFTSASNVTIQGIVTNLQEGATTVQVTLMGVIVDKLRRILLELDEPVYELAVKAYQARIPVLCQGDLVKQSRSFILHNPHNFTLDLEAWNS
ncbi:hypothetical protein [Iningainema tapete]|uniref:Uncharacterized protein n=1 Tax=Iningainema tapete BLCC-T55 TaxID=2748662 RepID=A0A8J7C878_9CYAN|nr:hypothetical protein [Iningainema tapete]MBD2774226.1 hypothetical protein [Iningainema tapete BLCC-T55]